MRPIIWSKEARSDYFSILRYIASDNPAAADKVVDAIEAAGNALGDFPTGRPGRVTGMYEKSVTRLPYVIAYELHAVADQEIVFILRVIHTSRNWPTEGWPP
ncbi:MAG: type II toxin-antitoxin system RelE/ParE family toxin [Pseudochelatococcus sp.]|uniref:type II toxin-antitoxin system RelE/ParE family toxin n=1 Tax=Pseudochelatococcus sp. TaxID=2020869 RepID=UPI003D8CF831